MGLGCREAGDRRRATGGGRLASADRPLTRKRHEQHDRQPTAGILQGARRAATPGLSPISAHPQVSVKVTPLAVALASRRASSAALS